MEKLFFTVLGMSATGSLVILAVLLARLALRKAPKAFSYALWAVALFRLLCPFTLDSAFSLLPSVRMVDAAGRGGGTDQVIQIQTGIPVLNSQVNGFLADHPYQEGQPTETRGEPGEDLVPVINQSGPVPDWRTVSAAIWLAGTAALLGYGALSLLGLRRRLAGSVPLEGEKNVRLAGHIPSPFVLGLVRPVIYLPSDLNEGERDYILLHERTHIRRFDHVTRGLAWLAAAVHWFNPLVWLAFYLAGRDMEMSCDEAVLRKMGREIRADYSASLLRLSQGGKLPAGPLAFGGSGFQSRIKNILNYKKPAFWVAALALAGVCVIGAALATNRAPGLFIDPDRVVSYTAADSSSYTSNPDHTSVSTGADRQKDLSDPAKQRPLSKEKGDELVRLVNAHRKSVYGQGELTLSGSEHQLVRMDCADGGWYLLDYWYWNGFSFNPLHYGEDSYTTLVTYYGPDGKAGTTWQMEYDFDRAYKDWLNGPEPALGLSYSYNEDGSRVVIDGSRAESMNWYISGQDEFTPLGVLSFGGLKLSNGWEALGAACWTSEDRNAIQMNLLSAPVSLTYTVVVDGSTERLIIQREVGGQIGENKEEDLHLPDEEVKELAGYFACCIWGAEEFYANARPAPDGDGMDLSYEVGQTDVGPFVRMTGKVYGQALERSAVWWPTGMEELYGGHSGGLSMRYTFAGGWAELMAWWADEEHKSVTLSSKTSATLSSYMPCGWWEFTVDLSGEQGRVASMEARGGETTGPNPVKMYPEIITSQEAVFAARIAAKLLTAAEDFYNNYDGPSQIEPFTAVYSITQEDSSGNRVRVSGLGNSFIEWSFATTPPDGSIYFAHDPTFFCPRLAGETVEGAAQWTDEEHRDRAIQVVFNVNDERVKSGTVCGFRAEFIVDLEQGIVTQRDFQSLVEGETLELTDEEMVYAARRLAEVLHGAEKFHHDTEPSPEPSPIVP